MVTEDCDAGVLRFFDPVAPPPTLDGVTPLGEREGAESEGGRLEGEVADRENLFSDATDDEELDFEAVSVCVVPWATLAALDAALCVCCVSLRRDREEGREERDEEEGERTETEEGP